MDYLKLKVNELKNRKNNINSDYTLALQDFRVIDNRNIRRSYY